MYATFFFLENTSVLLVAIFNVYFVTGLTDIEKYIENFNLSEPNQFYKPV